MPYRRAAIAIGSNLPSPVGDSPATTRAALVRIGIIPATRVLSVSSLHTTAPVGPAPQPLYTNGCALVESALSPRELLGHLLDIEREFGRDRAREQRWGPRALDLDLILFGDAVINEPGLHVPHPRMHERVFVLAPLSEVWPDAMHPVFRRTARELLEAAGG